jgi:large subunit ribosomal protein L1
MNFSESLKELREKSKKRNFDQTLDLIINFRGFDPRRDTLNTSTILPHISKKKKICAFLENPSKAVDYVITKTEIEKITADDLKKLTKEYDFFIASAKLMPVVATKFGKTLGIAGKMPDPKMGGVVMQESEAAIKESVHKLLQMVKIRAKEASIKVPIGKESMVNEELIENANAVLKAVIPALPKKELNIKSVMFKFTMSKPIKVKK